MVKNRTDTTSLVWVFDESVNTLGFTWSTFLDGLSYNDNNNEADV